MAYTIEEIKSSNQIYTLFERGETLPEHTNLLESLSINEKRALVTKLVHQCPDAELLQFKRKISASVGQNQSNDSFYTLLNDCIDIKIRIVRSLSEADKKPHSMFLSPEYNEIVYKLVSEFILKEFSGHERFMASQLATYTPPRHREQIKTTITTLFPSSTLAERVIEAFSLKTEIDTHLRGSSPENFFTSTNVSISLCKKYPAIFIHRISGDEHMIGELLAATESESIRKDILDFLLKLTEDDPNKNSIFNIILTTMKDELARLAITDEQNTQDTEETGSSISSIADANNPHRLFNNKQQKEETLQNSNNNIASAKY